MKKEIEQYYQPLFHFVRKRVNDPLDAEDLTQEIFYKLATSKNDDIQHVKSWMYTIAKNTITDFYRKKKHFTEELNDAFQEDVDSKGKVEDELSNCIRPFVDQLPAAYRSIIVLSELNGRSQKEIAEELKLNYVTVRSKVQRGRIKLKELITACCAIIQGGRGGIVDYESGDNCKNTC